MSLGCKFMDLWVLWVPAAIFKEGFYLWTFITYPKTHIPLLKVDKTNCTDSHYL